MSRADGSAGFTLIEMLVALAIFSLAAIALIKLEGTILASTAILQDRLIGQIVARNKAVEALTDPDPPGFGRIEGVEANAGRRWRWARTTARTSEPGVQRIDIVVTGDDGHMAGAITVFRVAA